MTHEQTFPLDNCCKPDKILTPLCTSQAQVLGTIVW